MSKFPQHYQYLDKLIELTERKGKVVPQDFEGGVEISIKEALHTNTCNKIADLFSVAMRPCAAAVVHEGILGICAIFT